MTPPSLLLPSKESCPCFKARVEYRANICTMDLYPYCTEPAKSLCTWFGEFCSCCCLPQLACSILPTTYQPLFPALYVQCTVIALHYVSAISITCKLMNMGMLKKSEHTVTGAMYMARWRQRDTVRKWMRYLCQKEITHQGNPGVMLQSDSLRQPLQIARVSHAD